jgi:phospholipase/carboxylesterase
VKQVLNVSKLRKQTYGPLSCTVVDGTPGTPPDRLVVLCHGFGAGGDDLVSLAPELMQRFPGELASARFVFPAAPMDLREYGIPGGRAWWPIDMVRLQQAAATGRLRDLRYEHPPRLPEVRQAFSTALEAMLADAGLGMDKTVIGGFSQGAMVTTDAMLHLEVRPAGLIVFSGTLLSEEDWRATAEKQGLQGLRVVQSHGRQDPVLPFSLAEELRAMLTSFGAEVDWNPFDGPHTISGPALMAAGRLITSV